jgi:hypothetical protein
MSKAVLKWLAALLTAAGVAVVAAVGTGPEGVDPWLAGVIAGVVGKAVSWLVSKIPA